MGEGGLCPELQAEGGPTPRVLLFACFPAPFSGNDGSFLPLGKRASPGAFPVMGWLTACLPEQSCLVSSLSLALQ